MINFLFRLKNAQSNVGFLEEKCTGMSPVLSFLGRDNGTM